MKPNLTILINKYESSRSFITNSDKLIELKNTLTTDTALCNRTMTSDQQLRPAMKTALSHQGRYASWRDLKIPRKSFRRKNQSQCRLRQQTVTSHHKRSIIPLVHPTGRQRNFNPAIRSVDCFIRQMRRIYGTIRLSDIYCLHSHLYTNESLKTNLYSTAKRVHYRNENCVAFSIIISALC